MSVSRYWKNKYFFSKRVTGGKKPQIVPHGLYSLCFLEADDLCDKIYDKYLELEKDENTAEEQAINFVTVVANAIAYHHERDISNEVSEIIKNNLESLREQLKEFKYDKIKISKVEEIAPDFFRIGTRLMPSKIKSQNEIFKKYILVKGLLNRIDYASSAGEEIQVERKNDFLLDKLENMLENWKKKNPQSDWNKLQKYMIKKRDKNVIAIAQTGMGKTEAGLLWIGDTKGFFILPLKLL